MIKVSFVVLAGSVTITPPASVFVVLFLGLVVVLLWSRLERKKRRVTGRADELHERAVANKKHRFGKK